MCNEIADEVNASLEAAQACDATEAFLLQSDTPSESAGVGSPKDLKQMALAADMDKDKHIWLEVSRNLDYYSKMQVRRSVKFQPDPEGDAVRTRPIQNLDELGRIHAAEYALPKAYRLYRAVAKISPVRERGKRVEKQQLLYLLIDASGSMEGERMHRAGGVLMNRLKAVVSGDAQVYVRFFDSFLHEEHFSDSPESAKSLIRLFEAENFSGGGTNIVGALRNTQERIETLLQREGGTHKTGDRAGHGRSRRCV